MRVAISRSLIAYLSVQAIAYVSSTVVYLNVILSVDSTALSKDYTHASLLRYLLCGIIATHGAVSGCEPSNA